MGLLSQQSSKMRHGFDHASHILFCYTLFSFIIDSVAFEHVFLNESLPVAGRQKRLFRSF